MTKEYIIYKGTATEALESIDGFIEKMRLFMEKYAGYSYKIKLSEEADNAQGRWVVDLKVSKNEQISETPEGSI